MSKYEQLIEYIINEQEDKARELFHQIVVEKSRDIYESLIDESDLEEMGNNPVDAMVDEITGDEQGMSEGEDEEMDIELDSEEDDDGMDMGGDDMGGEGELEDRVMDLEDALDELKAEFDALMSDEAGEEEHGDMGDEMSMGMGDEEDEEDEEDMMEGQDDEYDIEVAKEVDESVQESRQSRKMTEAEWIREYVEKINNGYPGNNSETASFSDNDSELTRNYRTCSLISAIANAAIAAMSSASAIQRARCAKCRVPGRPTYGLPTVWTPRGTEQRAFTVANHRTDHLPSYPLAYRRGNRREADLIERAAP